MRYIWTPWRMAYIVKADKTECVFCRKPSAGDDEAAFIVSRGRNVYTILNIYPYTIGHLMVCPFRHVGRWGDLTPEEHLETLEACQRAERALGRTYAPDSLHLGVNLGRPAGAGVVGHLRVHVVPYREADGLELAVRDRIDDLSEPIEETYRRVQAAMADL